MSEWLACRYFKGPELLVDYSSRNMVIQSTCGAWDACLQERVSERIEPFFHGYDNYDQLVKIAE
eukprot:CAMPEP_0202482286 /NCGR_PEP_ID=MMETSP1361-20130828/1724_1 /ASSEMBLY_ACC=CAM_ASM_000849 /TAXON_ID=210615 /ORGANISM="Staurosira complex sp., Strain CCMP2646" /LENGTH=63 /DNA_ID=CAMNT_0049110115 /DNA_START=206 /DNA_END=394 /DNA_ORIENTATION=+